MTLKKTIPILILLYLVSCSEKKKFNQESIKLYNKAYYFTQLNKLNDNQLDSAINLLDRATDIEQDYSNAYISRIQFLILKKDYNRALNTNKQIQRINPHQPMWIIQEGMIYELSGNIEKAKEIYNHGISKYELILEQAQEFELKLELEFIGSLVMANNPELAKNKLEEINQEYPNNKILKHFELMKKEDLLKQITRTK